MSEVMNNFSKENPIYRKHRIGMPVSYIKQENASSHIYYKTQCKHQSLTISDTLHQTKKKPESTKKIHSSNKNCQKMNVVPNDYNQHTVEIFVMWL